MSGMIYDGFDFEHWLDVMPTKPIAAETEVSTISVPGLDGEIFDGMRRKALTIPVRVRLKKTWMAEAELRHFLAPKLLKSEPKALVLPDDPVREYLAVLNGSSQLDRLWELGTTTLDFLCCDPVAYGREVTVEVPDKVYVDGTYPTEPTFDLTTTATIVIVTYSGGHIAIAEEVAVGASVVIDTANMTVTVNGSRADFTLGSDFPKLEPGDNLILVSGAEGTVTWRERWE